MSASSHYLEDLSFLLVEPNTFMRKVEKNVLATFGCHEFLEASEGAEALELVNRCHPDIVVTELVLDDGDDDGVELIRKLRGGESDEPLVPVVVLSSRCDLEWVVRARDAGINEFVTKPMSAKSLMRRIVEVIERPRPFVRVDDYFGPDRRRRAAPGELGSERRHITCEPVELVDRNAGMKQGEIDRLLAGQPLVPAHGPVLAAE